MAEYWLDLEYAPSSVTLLVAMGSVVCVFFLDASEVRRFLTIYPALIQRQILVVVYVFFSFVVSYFVSFAEFHFSHVSFVSEFRFLCVSFLSVDLVFLYASELLQ